MPYPRLCKRLAIGATFSPAGAAIGCVAANDSALMANGAEVSDFARFYLHHYLSSKLFEFVEEQP